MTTLLAGLATLAGEGPGHQALEAAKQLVADLLVPRRVSGPTVDKYFRKAIRTGAHRNLPKEAMALLYILRRWQRRIISTQLLTVLRNIFLQIELHTTRGQALLYGTLLAMKNPLHQITGLLENAAKHIAQLIYLGLSYLNNPPIYRIYG